MYFWWAYGDRGGIYVKDVDDADDRGTYDVHGDA